MKTQGEPNLGTKVDYEAKRFDDIRATLTQFSPAFQFIYKPIHICCTNQMTDFYMKCNTGLKWVDFYKLTLKNRLVSFSFHEMVLFFNSLKYQTRRNC